MMLVLEPFNAVEIFSRRSRSNGLSARRICEIANPPRAHSPHEVLTSNARNTAPSERTTYLERETELFLSVSSMVRFKSATHPRAEIFAILVTPSEFDEFVTVCDVTLWGWGWCENFPNTRVTHWVVGFRGCCSCFHV